MSEYLITKREICPISQTSDNLSGTWEETCTLCHGTGYIDTPVDLLDVLRELRWDVTVAYGRWGEEKLLPTSFTNLRLAEEK